MLYYVFLNDDRIDNTIPFATFKNVKDVWTLVKSLFRDGKSFDVYWDFDILLTN